MAVFRGDLFHHQRRARKLLLKEEGLTERCPNSQSWIGMGS